MLPGRSGSQTSEKYDVNKNNMSMSDDTLESVQRVVEQQPQNPLKLQP